MERIAVLHVGAHAQVRPRVVGHVGEERVLAAGDEQAGPGQPSAGAHDARLRQQLQVGEPEQVVGRALATGRVAEALHRHGRHERGRVALDLDGGEVGLARLDHDGAPERAGERLAVGADADLAGARRVGVRRQSLEHVHEEQAPGALGHAQLLEHGGQLGIGAVVDGLLQLVDVDLRRHAEEGGGASDVPVAHAEHRGASATVRHTDRHLDDQGDRVGDAPGVPLLEVQILALEGAGGRPIELDEEILDLSDGRHGREAAAAGCVTPRRSGCERQTERGGRWPSAVASFGVPSSHRVRSSGQGGNRTPDTRIFSPLARLTSHYCIGVVRSARQCVPARYKAERGASVVGAHGFHDP